MSDVTVFPWGNEPCTPGDAEWERRLEWAMSQPLTGWWWLSFVDMERPEGDRFLGVALVPGGNGIQAIVMAHAFGCNPGGEAAAMPLVDPQGSSRTPKVALRCRLFAGDEGRALAAMEPDEVCEPVA